MLYIMSSFIQLQPIGLYDLGWSPLRHMEQLLLVTSCDLPAGIGASLRTHARTYGLTNGRMDGHTDVTLEIVF